MAFITKLPVLSISNLLVPPVVKLILSALPLYIPVSGSSLNVYVGAPALPLAIPNLTPPVTCDVKYALVKFSLTVPPVENPRTFAPAEYIPVSGSPPNEYSGEPASVLILAWNILPVTVPLTSNFPAGVDIFAPIPKLPD